MLKKKIFFITAALCLFAVMYALIAENYLGFEPCPLCMVERYLLIVIMVLSFIAAIHKRKGFYITKIYALVIAIVAGFNIKVALHHQELINLPKDQQPLSCGAPLATLFHSIPMTELLQKVLSGSAECGDITWKVFGFLSPPIAVIILCAAIILMLLWIMVVRKRS